MSSAQIPVGGAFTDPTIYTMITPVVTADATGGVVEADSNSKFNTNIPLSKAMMVTELDWNYNYPTYETFVINAITHWNWVAQITESLSRTKTASDPLNIDYDYHERFINLPQATAVGFGSITFSSEVLSRRVLRHPWLTVAQQLNLVVSVYPQTDNGGGSKGPKVGAWAKIYFQLVDLNDALRLYLATRIQIASQA